MANKLSEILNVDNCEYRNLILKDKVSAEDFDHLPSKNIALICAAGEGKRFGGDIPKQYQNIDYTGVAQPILAVTLQKFLDNSDIDSVIVAINENTIHNDKLFVKVIKALHATGKYEREDIEGNFEKYPVKDLFDNLFQKLDTRMTLIAETEQEVFSLVDSDTFSSLYQLQNRLWYSESTLYKTSIKNLYFCFGFGERYHTVYSLLSNAMLLAHNEGFNAMTSRVLVHDAARCCITNEEISSVIKASCDMPFDYSRNVCQFKLPKIISFLIGLKGWKSGSDFNDTLACVYKSSVYNHGHGMFLTKAYSPSNIKMLQGVERVKNSNLFRFVPDEILKGVQAIDLLNRHAGLVAVSMVAPMSPLIVSLMVTQRLYFINISKINHHTDSSAQIAVACAKVDDTIAQLADAENGDGSIELVDRSTLRRHLTPQATSLLDYYFLMNEMLMLSKDKEFLKNLFYSKCFLPYDILIDVMPQANIPIYNLRSFGMHLDVVDKLGKNVRINDRGIADYLESVYDHFEDFFKDVTDDASFFNKMGAKVLYVPTSNTNIKITSPSDHRLAQALLALETN